MLSDRIMTIVSIVLIFIAFVFSFSLYRKLHPGKEYNRVKFMARVAMFGAMSAILYVVPFLTFNIPIFPSFLSFHFDEIPAFICGFAYGPLSGFGVLLIKTIIKLPMTSTMTVGEFGDLLLSSIYVLPSAFIYKRIRNLKGVAIGFAVSTVLQLLAAMIINVYVLVPFYQFMGMPFEVIFNAMKAANPAITDAQWSYAFFAVLPFNAIKDGLVIFATFLVYRSIHILLRFDKKAK